MPNRADGDAAGQKGEGWSGLREWGVGILEYEADSDKIHH